MTRGRLPVLVVSAVLGAPLLVHAQSPAVCRVAGTLTDRGHPLPGVVVTLVEPNGQIADVASSTPDGAFDLQAPAAGQYTITTDLLAFEHVSRSITIDPGHCPAPLAVTMTLASRGSPGAPAGASRGPARSVARQAGAPQQFQSLELLADQAGVGRVDDTGGDAPPTLLPPGFSADTSTEAVATIGDAQTNAASFVGADGSDVRAQRFGAQAPGQARQGQGGGPAGGRVGGGPPGGPGVFIRGSRASQIRGSFFENVESSALDTAPYSLSGTPTPKPDYFQQRFGATIGGPLGIPKLLDSAHNFFFVNYTGNHSRSPYSVFSTVPTVAQRGGDLSALGRTIIDPTTNQPFVGAQVPVSELNPAALDLLNLFPLPNEPGPTQNLHTETTTTNQIDDLNVRLTHEIGNASPQGRPTRAGRGGRGGQAGSSNLNVQIHFRRAENTDANPFPALSGDRTLTAVDTPVSYSFTKAGMLHNLHADFNHQRTENQNTFAGVQNVAGNAGLLGVSSDPFDWGAPGLAFNSFTSLRQGAPSTQTSQTIAIGDTVVKAKGTQTIRFGGDYRDVRTDSRTDANANGSFVFTGLYTGLDFADFLLGLPQQATVQYGPGLDQFRSRSADLFLQDDWRVAKAVTLNAGLRYQYYSPVSETDNRLATLDTSAGFADAIPVLGGGTGPFSGALPNSVVRPFRAGLAPRLGLAWRVTDNTILRAGYGINYNASVYQSIGLQLAAQPPFANVRTVLATASNPIPLQTALLSVTGPANTYGVDPNYRLPFVQIYNADLQRNLTRTVTVDVGYTGTKGTNLDLVSAPDRNPDGTLRIPGAAPFLWESSTGRSLMNSMTLSIRKRQSRGVALSASYTLSKSMDNASSIGGGGTVVAQNPQDLEAEWGLSSFDQRHRFSANAAYDLPFGANRRWLTKGTPAALFGNWQIAGAVQIASGTPFTARVLGNVRDVATGVNGTLRANYNGQPIALADPSATLFFNTAAFSLPTAGTYGDAGRNTIIGPGASNLDLTLTRSIPLSAANALSIQLVANNVLNTVQFASIDTTVNSPSFGRVTAARPMRTVQIVIRFRF